MKSSAHSEEWEPLPVASVGHKINAERRMENAELKKSFSLFIQENAPSHDTQAALRKPLDHLRIGLALGGEHARRQALGRVVVKHRHDPLRNYGTVIVLVIGEMDGTAGHFHASIQDGAMDRQTMIALAAEGRDQRGVNVQDAIAEIVGDVQQLEETGHTNAIDVGIAAVSEDAFAEFFARGTRFSFDDESRDVGLAGAGQSEGIGLAGNDDSDSCTEDAISDAIEEILQCGAAAADQDSQPNGIVHERLFAVAAAILSMHIARRICFLLQTSQCNQGEQAENALTLLGLKKASPALADRLPER
jgi:hypothetical protein